MRKRPLQIIGVALLIVAGVWTFYSLRSAPTDEALYQQWGRPILSRVACVLPSSQKHENHNSGYLPQDRRYVHCGV
jgi:hypothetical protein